MQFPNLRTPQPAVWGDGMTMTVNEQETIDRLALRMEPEDDELAQVMLHQRSDLQTAGWLLDEGASADRILHAAEKAEGGPLAGEVAKALAHMLLLPLWDETTALLDGETRPSDLLQRPPMDPPSYDRIVRVGAAHEREELPELQNDLARALVIGSRMETQQALATAGCMRDRLDAMVAEVKAIQPSRPTLLFEFDQAVAARTEAVGRMLTGHLAMEDERPGQTAMAIIEEPDGERAKQARRQLRGWPTEDARRAVSWMADLVGEHMGISDWASREACRRAAAQRLRALTA